MSNDFLDWLQELTEAANGVVDNWDNNDLSKYVNELRELLEEGGYRDA